MTSPIDLQDKLSELRVLPSETEWIEFKEAKNTFDFDDLGKYFSALSNEANLKNQSSGWLVFGLKDKPIPRQIVGTNYRPQRPDLDSLKQEIANTSCLRAWRADTSSAGVEGPGSIAPLKRVRPGGPAHHGSITCNRLNWYVSPSGLAFHGVPLTGGSHHRHRLCQPFGLMDPHSSIKSKRL